MCPAVEQFGMQMLRETILNTGRYRVTKNSWQLISNFPSFLKDLYQQLASHQKKPRMQFFKKNFTQTRAHINRPYKI